MLNLACGGGAGTTGSRDATSSGGTETTANSEATGTAMGTAASEDTAPEACTALFGRPTAATGLTDAQCRPECPCLDGWVPPSYDEAAIAALDLLTLSNPPATLDTDPYLTPEAFPSTQDQVCGVLVEGSSYTLQSFEGPAQAQRAGATVTHDGGCGRCSPLHDLAVYMRNGDLTEPVRACALLGIASGDDATLQCLLDLDFTLPCAQTWLYNTVHTREQCTDECLGALQDPYHLPDGTLNPCLVCDEEHSGPIFKAVAGRTRRNTGLPSALCRPCQDVNRLVHVYQ